MHYPPQDVFYYDPRHPEDRPVMIGSLKKKEMVFDLLVAGWCSDKIRLTMEGKSYPRLKRSVWAIESEVSIYVSEVLFDFNKLLLSSAPNRLFVTRNRECNIRFSEFLLAAAADYLDDRDIYIAYIPRFNESRTSNKTASPEWLKEGGDIMFVIHVIARNGVRCLSKQGRDCSC